MADLSTNFLGIKSPNPFWLASAPPTDKAYNVERAFEAGWGGVVWKTLGEAGPPVVNVNGPRYGAIWGPDRRLLGLNNIELITDRDLETNLREIAEVKKRLARPGHDRLDHGALRGGKLEGDPAARRGHRRRRHRAQFRLPARHERARHGIGRRPGARIHRDGRGWCKQYTRSMPVIVKLTPNITDIRYPAGRPRRAAPTRVADQHDFLDRLGRSRQFRADADDRRQGLAWRLLRPGGQADRAQHGGRDRPRRGDARPADFRHRRRARPGAMRPSSSHWAAAPCRSAPRP
jgi:hypothetical protein